MAKVIIAPVKAPTASLNAVLASTGILRIGVVPDFQALVTAMRKDVNVPDKARNDLDKASNDELQLAGRRVSTVCGILSATACRRRDGGDRKDAR